MCYLSRREFLAASVVGLSASRTGVFAAQTARQRPSLASEVGITTSSVARQLSTAPQGEQFSLLELPRLMRDELDMRVIDLNTSSLTSLEPDYLDQLRAAADKHGCFLTNLKMNYPQLDMGSPDAAARQLRPQHVTVGVDLGQRREVLAAALAAAAVGEVERLLRRLRGAVGRHVDVAGSLGRRVRRDGRGGAGEGRRGLGLGIGFGCGLVVHSWRLPIIAAMPRPSRRSGTGTGTGTGSSRRALGSPT